MSAGNDDGQDAANTDRLQGRYAIAAWQFKVSPVCNNTRRSKPFASRANLRVPMESRQLLVVTLTELREKIAATDGNVVAFEALWDGDTSGWFVCLSAILDQPSDQHPGYTSLFLCCWQEGGDIRLFNGQVPPWPEAVKAAELGQALADEHGAPFYFPSPHVPDDACAVWWERETSHKCPDCSVALMARYSTGPWDGSCRACQNKRKDADGFWVYINVYIKRARDVSWFEVQRETLQRELVDTGSGIISVMNALDDSELWVMAVIDERESGSEAVLRWLRTNDLLEHAKVRLSPRVNVSEQIWPILQS